MLFSKKIRVRVFKGSLFVSSAMLVFLFQNCSSGSFTSISYDLSSNESAASNSSSDTEGHNGSSDSGNGSGGSGTGGSTPSADLTGLLRAKSVYAGVGIGCAIDLDNRARCWGVSPLGQAQIISSIKPIEPIGLGPVTAIAGNSDSVCAINTAKQVLCWSNTATDKVFTPRAVAGLENVEALESGLGHFCALTVDKRILCWGLNNFGQTGAVNETSTANPFEVRGLGPVKGMKVGMYSSCAITTDNRLLCWGNNQSGLLGTNAQGLRFSATPIEVTGLGSVQSIRIGNFHMCALNADQRVLCWGYNGVGQLGDNSTNASMAPVEVSSVKGAVDIVVSNNDSCARLPNGTTKCWGAIVNSLTPIEYKPFNDFKKISMGYRFGCGLTALDTVRCWGNNEGLQLGQSNSFTASEFPVLLQIGLHSLMQNPFAQLQKNTLLASFGGYFRCGLTADRKVQCWGSTSSSSYFENPTEVSGLGPVKTFSLGSSHSCAVTANDAAKCWGSNATGALGNNSKVDSAMPVDVLGLGPVKSIAAGLDGFTCAITMNDQMKCWGYNANGTLGNNSTTDSLVPVDPMGLGSVKSMALGQNFACAITTQDKVKCWGSPTILGKSNFSGNETMYVSGRLPYEISSLGTVKAIVAGSRHACALTTTNQVKCWGESTNMRLGVSAANLTSVEPVTVPGVDGALSIAGRFGSTCASLNDGRIKCWGENLYGKLGVGHLINYIAPSLVGTAPLGTTDIVFDWNSTYFIDTASNKMWGSGLLTPNTSGPGADIKQ